MMITIVIMIRMIMIRMVMIMIRMIMVIIANPENSIIPLCHLDCKR